VADELAGRGPATTPALHAQAHGESDERDRRHRGYGGTSCPPPSPTPAGHLHPPIE